MIIGYFLALFIGLSLGLMGGGGSILTVPILVYVLGMSPKLSIALSMAIVGTTSFIGCLGHYKKGNIDLRVAMLFSPVAMFGTFIGTRVAKYMDGSTQLIIFAIIMLIASTLMFKKKKVVDDSKSKEMNHVLIVAQALFVGTTTGIVGVGGGFIIVPALVLLAHIPMKKAVGTSLFIIAMNSFAGFISYQGQFDIPWQFLGTFIVFTSIGILAGTRLIAYIPQDKLKKAFAVFLIIMGCFILYKNKDKMLNNSKTSLNIGAQSVTIS